MPMSDYVLSLRERIGNDFLLLPGVTAVIRDGDRFLLGRAASGEWSLIGGGVEPGEQPAEAITREIFEETGAEARIRRIVGAYGGEPLTFDYPNGDRAGYVTTAYECHLAGPAEPDGEEIAELGWFSREEIRELPRQGWIDQVIADAVIDRSDTMPV